MDACMCVPHSQDIITVLDLIVEASYVSALSNVYTHTSRIDNTCSVAAAMLQMSCHKIYS